ncbi:MAG: DNA-directed RNA polymerase subunit beta [Candidatus Bipolaricaulota bacterium]|nr:DNA-directed RNA polymerase subunit beta [Candidatus Bipolaricaulota bacterium]MDW8151653.1 DNA-directed RNA polymerase subunit beta [Candidatus Bipolaricaulota bacterium]
MAPRRSYGRVLPRLEPPDFIAHQLQSYERFLREGIPQVFAEVSPIRAPGRDDLYLELLDPSLGEPRYDEWECRDRDLTYAAPLRATGRLWVEGKFRQEAELYLADIPLMTPRGTFIINGTENVIVSELVRSPGLYLTQDEPHLFRAHFLPEQGAWLEIELDVKRWSLKVRLDRRATVPATTYLRALGLDTPEILRRYSRPVPVETLEELLPRWKAVLLAEPIAAGDEVWQLGEELTPERVKVLHRLGRTSVRVAHPAIARSLLEEKVASREEAIRLIYSKFRSGERVPLSQAEEYLARFYFRPDTYHLTKVGRFKINRKLGHSREETYLVPEDVFAALDLLLRAPEEPELLDEPDHLANKRVRLAGEQAQAALREGLVRMARVAEDKLIHLELEEKDLIRRIVSTRTIQAAINSLFYTGRLSQFLEQTNPLSELTHKRRLSAIGSPAARRAKVEIRDVHPSHYARICPIETPEGQNVGLITSMAVYVRVNEFGFLEAPYVVVRNGRLTKEIRYLMADEEERYKIAPATVKVDKDGRIVEPQVLVRTGREEFRYVPPEEVDFVEVAPNMILGVSAALIPFLEHDDANRALMGANMQRQAVALLRPQAPIVGTGMEAKAARDSGAVVVAEEDGTVTYVDAQRIVVRGKKGERTYRLRVFERSNQDTLIHQRPLVRKGDKVKKGQVLADSQFTEGGELALGANLLVAFLPFEGYNYEDAIVVSERLVRENLLDSIHIQEFEVRAEDTKLGPEEITADIPNLPRSAMRNLDEHGIVRVGTEVRTGDILVGKITPKGESEPTPEERIFLSIFGERMRNFKNTSLRMPPITGTATVIRVKRLSRAAGDELEAGVNELVKVYVAQRRRIAVGDKLAGRHGNKGVIAAILPVEDMPFLPDGTPVDVILNPLGVPSRMNLGQIFETNLGWLAALRGEKVASPPFDGAKEEEVLRELTAELQKRGLSDGSRADGKVILRDGRTGEPFQSPVTVGVMYLLKLEHIAADKIHARSTGPYALITQQPLGGRAHFGGQRLGEMEVWALEAYGAASLLQEMLTLKSDDVRGRVALYKAILRGEDFPRPGIPESFKVLWQELRCLGLSLKAYDKSGRELDIV